MTVENCPALLSVRSSRNDYLPPCLSLASANTVPGGKEFQPPGRPSTGAISKPNSSGVTGAGACATAVAASRTATEMKPDVLRQRLVIRFSLFERQYESAARANRDFLGCNGFLRRKGFALEPKEVNSVGDERALFAHA